MDMGFLRRAERMLGDRQPLRLDHHLLVAAVAAQQVSAATRVRLCTLDTEVEPDDEPLIEILLAGPGWRRAAARQRGCFSRAEAGRRFNAP